MERMGVTEKIYEDKLMTLLRKFALKSRQFSDKYCFADGLMEIMKFNLYEDNIPDNTLYSSRLSYDYDYYAFTKSTKTLHAIWTLLKDENYNFNEDIMMLVRSIFENHIMSRYFREHIDIENERKKVIQEFVRNPLGVTLDYYKLDGFNIKDNKGESLGKLKMPNRYKIGEEKEYYTEFYSFLCQFAHCSFGNIECYFDVVNYHYDKNNYRLEALLFTIFVFTKIFEGIATVEGENYNTSKEERGYYDLVYDALELQKSIFDYLVEKYSYENEEKDIRIIQLYLNRRDKNSRNAKMKQMLIKMKSSLDEEIGSLKKDKIDRTTDIYIRQYPIVD